MPIIQTASRKAIAAPAKPTNDCPTLAALSKLYVEEGKRGGTWRTVSTFEVERDLHYLLELMGDMAAAAFDVH